MAELAAYRLTAATLQKVTVATQALQKGLENDPKYKGYMAAQRELKALEEKEDRTAVDEQRIEALERQLEKAPDEINAGDANTLAEMERAISKIPHMSEALSEAGLSPREYAKFSLAMLQAGFLAGLKKAGQLKEVPPGASIENVQFMIDHEKEIAALTRMIGSK
jgi:hypothetical protein